MSRLKVAPTQLTRRPDRQGSIPKSAKGQASRKRGEKHVVPVENRLSAHAPRAKGQRSTSILDFSKSRAGVRGSKSQGARHAKHHRGTARSPSVR